MNKEVQKEIEEINVEEIYAEVNNIMDEYVDEMNDEFTSLKLRINNLESSLQKCHEAIINLQNIIINHLLNNKEGGK